MSSAFSLVLSSKKGYKNFSIGALHKETVVYCKRIIQQRRVFDIVIIIIIISTGWNKGENEGTKFNKWKKSSLITYMKYLK